MEKQRLKVITFISFSIANQNDIQYIIYTATILSQGSDISEAPI